MSSNEETKSSRKAIWDCDVHDRVFRNEDNPNQEQKERFVVVKLQYPDTKENITGLSRPRCRAKDCKNCPRPECFRDFFRTCPNTTYTDPRKDEDTVTKLWKDEMFNHTRWCSQNGKQLSYIAMWKSLTIMIIQCGFFFQIMGKSGWKRNASERKLIVIGKRNKRERPQKRVHLQNS